MRSDIFLHFLNRDGRQIHGLFRDLKSSDHDRIIARALNAAAMLCESYCYAPPGFLLECEIAQGVIERKHEFLDQELIALPMREGSLSDFAEKKRREYSPVRNLFQGLFSDERIDFLAAHATKLVPREVAVGKSAVALWEAGPDDGGRDWIAVKAKVSSHSLEIARELPRRLIEEGAALTWFGMKPLLPEDLVAAEPEVRRVLQRNYFSLYSNEFPVVVLRGIPRLHDAFDLPSEPRVYNYSWFKACLEQLSLEKLLDADAGTILILRRQSGFIRFVDAYAGLCRACQTCVDLRFNIDRFARKLGVDWLKFRRQFRAVVGGNETTLSDLRVVEVGDALDSLAALIEHAYSLLDRTAPLRPRISLEELREAKFQEGRFVLFGDGEPSSLLMEDMEMREGDSISASIAFFTIPTLKLQGANTIGGAMHGLHAVLKNLLTQKGVRVLSSPTGGIVVVLDQRQPFFIHTILARVAAALTARHIPIRIGVTRGDVESVREIDETLNLIGPAINRAARLAVSSTNEGCLFDKAYFDFSQTRVGEPDRLDPSRGQATSVKGKEHDAIIQCWTAPALRVLNGFNNEPRFDETSPGTVSLTGAVLAYDLPRFSAGDPASLRSRFRSIRDTVDQLKRRHGLGSVALSPGGDGGWLLLPVDEVSKDRGYQFAERIVSAFAVEDDNKSATAGALSRVGLHYGPVVLYMDAEGAWRPTGPTCFIADMLAGDTIEGSGLVISGEFESIPTFGSRSRFQAEYRSLPEIMFNGVTVARYQRA